MYANTSTQPVRAVVFVLPFVAGKLYYKHYLRKYILNKKLSPMQRWN